MGFWELLFGEKKTDKSATPIVDDKKSNFDKEMFDLFILDQLLSGHDNDDSNKIDKKIKNDD